MSCLLKQQDCGLKAGDTQCGKCGLRPADKFVSREDRDLATLKATALYWQNHAKALEERNQESQIPPVATSSSHAVGEVFKDLPEGPEMVVIPSGSYMMGSAADEPYSSHDERPRHRVTIAYRLAVGKYPVTFAQWDACVADGGTKHQPEDEGWGRGQRPVINVSWDDVQEYVAWFNRKLGLSEGDLYRYRLLSEAEWEYACRAGNLGKWCFGDDESCLTDYGWYKENSEGKTQPSGKKEPNAFGLYDMHGNVWELVEDCWHLTYRGTPPDNGSAWVVGWHGSTFGTPQDNGAAWVVENQERVRRGGAWKHGSQDLRSTIRTSYSPQIRCAYNSFRLARTLPLVTSN